ncbi:MAG: alginate export family protein, partial [Myxococcota bacterium]|nr:alginate export family protein [Myxococcota bacterium]
MLLRLWLCIAPLLVLVPPASADLADSPLALGTSRRARLVKRPDQRRPADQLTVPLFGRPLTIGGEYEFELRYERDRRLIGTPNGDDLAISQRVEIELMYLPFKDVLLYIEGKGFLKTVAWSEQGDTAYKFIAERGEMWIYLADLFGSPFNLQVGRQRLYDRSREWWWDQDLDTARVSFDLANVQIEAMVAQELFTVSTLDDDIRPEDDGVLRVLAHAKWRYAERQHVELFLNHENDRSRRHCDGSVVRPDCPEPLFPKPGVDNPPDRVFREDEDDRDSVVTWVGAAANGRLKGPLGRLYYSGQVAGIFGEETTYDYSTIIPLEFPPDPTRFVKEANEHDVQGWGLDLVATWVTNWDWAPGILRPPALSIGYAYGSGDGDTDFESFGGFRQSVLADNNGKLRGVNRFRYYGELLDPNLSNLQIVTAALG